MVMLAQEITTNYVCHNILTKGLMFVQEAIDSEHVEVVKLLMRAWSFACNIDT